MNIALAQIDIKAGDPKANVAKMLEYIEKAKAKKADVVAFPEMCVGGYLIGDLWLDDEYCRYLMEFNQQLIDASDGIAVIWGNVYLDERETISRCAAKNLPVGVHMEAEYADNSVRNVHNDGRKRRYNAAYAYKDGQPLKRYRGSDAIPDGLQFKSLLPNYREFDDKRYFSSTLDLIRSECVSELGAVSPFRINIDGVAYRIGVEICEDLWCDDYDFNPTQLMYGFSDAIINLSSSPWTCGKNRARDRRVKNVVNWKNNGVPFYYVNCVGVQNNGKNFFTFDGGSTVYGDDGSPKILAKEPYKEELLIANWDDIPTVNAKRKNRMMIEEKYLAIVRGIQHLRDITGRQKYVVGASGGIDSSLVLCLLEKAVGAENIIAINMPSQYNSSKTKFAAKKVCDKLDIKDYRVVPIEKIVGAKVNSIFGGEPPKGIVDENIQAETRGMILSAIAGNEGAFFTCNANKIELAIGYFTLNADGRGAIAPIADLTKEEVYKMADFLNKDVFKKEVVPQNMMPNDNFQFVGQDKIEPSAELKNNQIDPIKIGYTDKIIEQFMDYMKKSPNQIMRWWLEGELHKELGISKELMTIYGMDNADVFIDDLKWLYSRIRASVFKRVQSPPLITVSKTSFGYDLRESILSSDTNLILNVFNKDLISLLMEKETY